MCISILNLSVNKYTVCKVKDCDNIYVFHLAIINRKIISPFFFWFSTKIHICIISVISYGQQYSILNIIKISLKLWPVNGKQESGGRTNKPTY